MNINQPDDITFEILEQNPDIYRNRLMTLINGLDWDRSIHDVIGIQPSKIVEFCLDFRNIDRINSSVNELLENPELANLDVQDQLELINSYNPNGRDNSKSDREKIERRRLVCWVHYLDQVMKSTEVEFVTAVQENNRNSAA